MVVIAIAHFFKRLMDITLSILLLTLLSPLMLIVAIFIKLKLVINEFAADVHLCFEILLHYPGAIRNRSHQNLFLFLFNRLFA